MSESDFRALGDCPVENHHEAVEAYVRAWEEGRRARESEEALLYYLKIYDHAHSTGNSVPPNIVNDARVTMGATEFEHGS